MKFFIWVACLDRCWTAEWLTWQGLPHPVCCLLCDQSEETMMLLLTGCPLTRTIWHEVLSWL
jgi:hypothetical protein